MSGCSQSPSVESATWRTPDRGERGDERAPFLAWPPRRSARAAGGRSCRRAVAAPSRDRRGAARRRRRALAREDRGSRPRAPRAAPASRKSGGRQSGVPRKSETTTTSARWRATRSASSSASRSLPRPPGGQLAEQVQGVEQGTPSLAGRLDRLLASRTRPCRAGCPAASPRSPRRRRRPRRHPPCGARRCRTPSTPTRRARAT